MDYATLVKLVELSLSNPIVVGLLMAVLRNILGYLENYAKTKEKYEKAQFVETAARDVGVAVLAYLGNYNSASAVVVVELVFKTINEYKKV